MAQIHGSSAAATIGGDALTGHINNSGVEVSKDTHDVTTYGAAGHKFKAGLWNGTSTLSGIYDSTAVTGPRAILVAAFGTNQEFEWMPEGVGAGKALTTVEVVVGKYVETAPVADMITWSCDLQHSGTPDFTAQPA